MKTASNSRVLRTIPLLIAVCFVSFPAYAQYGGGTGEPNDPYRIATAGDLMLLGESPDDYDKHFILTADIDLDPNLPGRKVFDKAVIAPDLNPNDWCFQGTAFAGVFDGNGHMISHLTIEGESYLGLFGQLGSGAKISNLGLEAIDVNGIGTYVGGLVGRNDGRITNCYSTGTISGDWEIGGLVGRNDIDGSITASYSTGTVSGNDSVGGLVGGSGYSTITNCYSTGSVSGNNFVGGLLGFNHGTITNCYSVGRVTGTTTVGGLVGVGGRTTGSFWDIETSGQVTSDDGTGKTTVEMQNSNTFMDAGWDFVDETENGTEDIWWILEGQDYPRLWWEAAEQ